MARGINKVILIGNLGKQPETKTFANGGSLTNATLATSESWKDRDGNQQERTEWHNLTFHNKPGEIVAKYCGKGSKIYVEGSLRTRKWQDKDGRDRYTTEIHCHEMQMLDGRSDSSPATQSRPAQTAAPAGGADEPVDDIPF